MLATRLCRFMVRGMNSGFEDCSVLNELLEEHGTGWETIFRKFEVMRKPNADAIADLAMRNFVEMRDLTGNPQFLLQKQIEAHFHEKYPDKWIPLLFHGDLQSYSVCGGFEGGGERQNRIMAEVMAMPSVHLIWDTIEVEEKILRLLEEY